MKPTRSPECRDENHKDCIGRIERLNWNEHDRECQCPCHKPLSEHRYWRLRDKEINEPEK